MRLLVNGLACWRISNMLVNERGPFNLLVGLRELTGIRHDSEGEPISWGDASPLSCVLCTSIWVALLLLVVPDWIKEVFAVSGIAAWLEQVSLRS